MPIEPTWEETESVEEPKWEDTTDVETKTPGFLGPAFPLQEGEPSAPLQQAAPIPQEVMQDVPWMTRFRMSPVGRTLLGPTEEEKAGMAGEASGARIKPQEIAEQALEATTPAKALPFLSQVAPFVPLSPISPLLGGLPKAFESGIKEAAINFPLAPLPGPKTAAGRAALVAFGTQFLASQPETLKAFKDAIKRKDYDEATKIAATELAMAAGLGLGGKEALTKAKPPALPAEKAIAAAEPILPQAAQAAKETKGAEYASEISPTAEVHGDVQPFAGKGVREVPVEEGGAGVQPQTEGRIPEAQAPSPPPGQRGVLLTPKETESTPPPKETPTAPSAAEPSSQTPATQGISEATTPSEKAQVSTEPFLGKTKVEWTPEYYKSLSPENRRAARAQVISALKSEGGTTKVTQESKPPVVIKGIHELLDLREKKKAATPKFTLSEDKTNVTFTDPNTGNTIVARIERVPGEKGEGAFVPTIDISTPTRVGGSSNPGNFTQSFEQAQAQLKQMLENKGFSGLQASKITEASLAYGGSWKEGVLEKQKGYDPEVAAEQERFIGKIQQIGEKAKEEFAKQRQPEAFGAGPPEAGQWLTDQDIAKIPKLVKDYGDFWVVLKWAASPREAIRASDLAKHYDRIIKGKEAANQYEYLREVFVRQDPFKDVEKPPPTEPPPTLQMRILPPLGIVEFVKQDVIPFVKKGVDTAKATAKLFVDTFSPASHAETPDVNILFEGKGFKEKVETRIVSAFENMKKRFDAMLQADQIAFVDRVKRGQAQPTPELQATANLIRKWDDVLYSLITRYKPTVPYLDNHMRVLWQKVPGQPTAIGTQKAGIRGKRPFQGSKGFLKKHVLADMSEGIRLGGVPVTYNPVELFTLHAQDVMKFVAANRAWEGLKRIGSVEFVRRGHKAPVGFVRFDDPIAKTYFRVPQGLVAPGEYYVQEGTGRMLHNYLSRDWVRTGPAGPIGRALLGLKNFTTNIELGMSPFHAFFESNEAIGSSFGLGLRKISSGQYAAGLKDIAQALPSSIPIVGPLIPKTAPWETAKLGGRLIKYAKNPAEFAAQDPEGFAWLRQHYPETQKLVNDLFTAGGQVGMHQEYRYALRRGFAQAVKTENYVGAVIRALPALNQVMQKPLFETYIPRLKVGMWLREYSQALVDRAGDLASGRTTRPQLARETWSFIEDRFGELNWDNLYWNRTMKSAMQLMFRSVTWKLGNLRGFGKAGRDVAGEVLWRAIGQGKAPRMSYPMMWLAGMSLVTAIQSSIISKVSTGKYPWELVDEGLGYLKSGVDLLKNLTFPRIDSKDPTQRVSIPTYWRDAVHIARSAKGLGWDYIRSSMTGEINRFAESLNNKDFYGNPIYNPLDPIQKRAYDFMAHLVPTPFGISSYQRATETGASTPQALAGVAGYTKAPAAIEPAPTSQVYELAENWMAQQGGKTQETARRRAVQEQRHAEEPSIYQPLKIALKANRMEDAGKEYDKLLALRRSTESVSDRHKQILLALRPFTMGKKEPGTDYQPKHIKPFTGNLADEKKFLKSLTPEQRKIYDAAIASKQEIYQRFLELMKTR